MVKLYNGCFQTWWCEWKNEERSKSILL